MNKKNLALAALALTGSLASMPGSAQEVMARVLSSTAVLQQVAVPRQVCTTQQVVQQTQPSGAGAAMGAIAGGAVGNAIGDGSGRAVATMIGLVGGAILGNKIEGTRDEVRNVQQCTTQTTYESRVLHYDVIYEYDNKRYSIKMPNDPGSHVRLQLNPMGAIPGGSSGTTTFTSPVSVAPAPVTTVTYLQAAPVYAAPIHVHPAAAFTVHPGAAFTVYPAVRYAPVAPISLTIHGGHRHPKRHWH
jgi:uncharacterized protein YcfJ